MTDDTHNQSSTYCLHSRNNIQTVTSETLICTPETSSGINLLTLAQRDYTGLDCDKILSRDIIQVSAMLTGVAETTMLRYFQGKHMQARRFQTRQKYTEKPIREVNP